MRQLCLRSVNDMRMVWLGKTFLTIVGCVSLVACGGSSTPKPPNNPAPVVQSLSPTSIAAGSNGFTLAVNGSGFISSSSVAWNGTARRATLVSSSQLTIPVAAADLQAIGTASVVVTNPSPGGGQSSASFAISAPAAPTVTGLSPSSTPMGGSGLTLTVNGTNFVQGSTVQWNGSSRTTTYVSNTQLQAAITTADVQNPGQVPVTVVTPAPGGGTSGAVSMAVTYPLPVVDGVTPASITAGQTLTLTINGSNFFPGATSYWNTTAARVTQFVSSTQLTMTLLPADVVSGSVASISVQNPPPTAGMSNSVPFTVNNPSPTIGSLSTTTQVAGTKISLTITGTGFVPASIVHLGAQSVTASSVSSNGTQLTANFVSAPVGTLPVSVVNGAPQGGTSNTVDFDSIPAGTGITQALVSIDPGGTAVDEASGAISDTGRYVAFGEFVRDTCVGVANGCTPLTLRYSTNADTASGVDDTGRYVTSQLHTSGTIGDLKFWDTCFGVVSGCTASTITVPIADGDAIPVGGTWLVPDARYLSYSTGSTTPNNPPPLVVNLFDTCVGAPLGCTPAPIPTGQTTPGGYYSVTQNALSATPDGRYLVYTDPNYAIDLYDSCLGTPQGTCSPSNNVQFSVAPPGACEHPSISATGRYIAFGCRVQEMEIRLQDTCLGVTTGCTANTTTITSTVFGASSSAPMISADGRFVAFVTNAAIVKGQTMDNPSVFLYDTCAGVITGCTPTTTPVPICLAADGSMANAPCDLEGMSSDGKYILISTPATNLGATLPVGVSNGVYVAVNPLK